jgi:hypothetical protein
MNRFTRPLLIMLLLFFFLDIGLAQEGRKKRNKKEDARTEQGTDDELMEQEDEEECEVLLPSISDTYEGRCKNGLAHGKGKAMGKDTYEGDFKKGYPHGRGIFTYENGDVYDGAFREGRRDGEGSLTTTINGNDTILAGIWMDGVYAGPKPKHPRVLYKYGVDSYSIKRTRDGNRFLIDIYLNGMPNSDLQDFAIVSSSGTQLQLGRSIGFENVVFPAICKISYKSWNKLRTARHEVIFEFKIEDPGDWKIKIIN